MNVIILLVIIDILAYVVDTPWRIINWIKIILRIRTIKVIRYKPNLYPEIQGKVFTVEKETYEMGELIITIRRGGRIFKANYNELKFKQL